MEFVTKKDRYGHKWFERGTAICPYQCKRCGALSGSINAGRKCKKVKKERAKQEAKPFTPRQCSLVRFDFDGLPVEYHSQYPFTRKAVYVFLGEIPNMPEHCAVADKAGRIYSCYHTDDFVELTEEEV